MRQLPLAARSTRIKGKDVSLFRQEAIDARQTKWLGDIVLSRPVSFTVISALAAGIVLVTAVFLALGSYTRRVSIPGQLVAAGGQIKLYPPQPGTVLQRLVDEGQAVKKGQQLFKISGERYDGNAAPVLEASRRQLAHRRDLLAVEAEKVGRLHHDERQALMGKVASLRVELSSLSRQLASQRDLVSLAIDATRRYQGLNDQGYISKDQLQQRQVELLAQQQASDRLAREHAAVAQQLAERGTELAGLSNRQANQLTQVQRQLSVAEQELAESEARRMLVITAPEDGIATAVLADVGQTVDTLRPLATLVPADAVLQVELHAPSRSIGFIELGDVVQIRYEAYPYQKFGIHRGTLRSISKTSIPVSDLQNAPAGTRRGENLNEPLYRLRVDLDSQTVAAYGEQRPLHSGMLLDAEILTDTRRIYEWALEPLFSVTGRL